MNKPLSEWTLAEVKAECKKHTLKCADCLFWTDTDCRIQINMALADYPEKWDLSEPLRWTEQDKQDAANMKRALPLANNISRSTKGDLLVDFKGPEIYPGFFAYYGLFPSLKPGESATLDEIIGDGDQ